MSDINASETSSIPGHHHSPTPYLDEAHTRERDLKMTRTFRVSVTLGIDLAALVGSMQSLSAGTQMPTQRTQSKNTRCGPRISARDPATSNTCIGLHHLFSAGNSRRRATDMFKSEPQLECQSQRTFTQHAASTYRRMMMTPLLDTHRVHWPR
jgi:hypothetical protein